MTLRDILVHVDDTPHCTARLQLAAGLARTHAARLTALHVIDIQLPMIIANDAAGGGGMAVAQLMEQLQQQSLQAATRLRAAFEEMARREGLAAAWQQVEGLLPQQVGRQARCADLCVLGQASPEDAQPAASAIIAEALFQSGRPVLVIPYAGAPLTCGRRVLVGWNGSREATRAVHDALPLLVQAEAVTLLIADDGEEALPGTDIADHLARHGVTLTVRRQPAEGLDAGDLLLNVAAETSADLLVVGGYGHSRAREWIFGGVTRTLLRSMTLPVLLSH